MLNRTAEAKAGREMAKTSSRTGCWVSGPLMGKSFSIKLKPADIRTLTYTVLTPKSFPSIAKPSTRRAMLMMKVQVLARWKKPGPEQRQYR